MDAVEVPVAVTAIVVGCGTVVLAFKYVSQALGRIFGAAPPEESETERIVRRVVREETREAVRPLREKLDRLGAARPQHGEPRPEKPGAPRRRLPADRFEEDPHDFGLIAGNDDAQPAAGPAPESGQA